ncbi:solute carrier family 35 member D3 [Thecamonas trahens ATCC 50062]|uniref:Solute carrier family 35 member D3 n=1 Tax=Thecamonas trahens ATCC 50062 TaxID=461836 RepID=A0A0L0D6X6_THETB|nr:solute carrier family 35 member D3 [Thecamonas trahens ATCC 50062]KNC48084.1 solute carrier family 35 member D3 [Thecamonas trahens ATCC 50062]|eukprot:XP_013759097.1 solute carrier family 35 member D3 [Thecamonas trahens ATCC 50062]
MAVIDLVHMVVIDLVTSCMVHIAWISAVVNSCVMLFNKHTFLPFGFHFMPATIFCQLIVTCMGLLAARAAGLVSFPPPNRSVISVYTPIAISYAFSSLLSLIALHSLPLLVFAVLKRCNVVGVLVAQRVVFGTAIPPARATFALIIAFGAGLAVGGAESGVNALGLVAAVGAIASRAVHLLLVSARARARSPVPESADRSLSKDDDSIVTLIFYSCALSLPLMALIAAASTDWTALRAYQFWGEPAFIVALAIFLVEGIVLQTTLLVCTMRTSALTTAVVSNLKLPIVTLLSLAFVGSLDFVAQPRIARFIAGMAVCTLGGLGYTWAALSAKA